MFASGFHKRMEAGLMGPASPPLKKEPQLPCPFSHPLHSQGSWQCNYLSQPAAHFPDGLFRANFKCQIILSLPTMILSQLVV